MKNILFIIFLLSISFSDSLVKNTFKKPIIYLDVMMSNKIDAELHLVDFNNNLSFGFLSGEDEFDGTSLSLGLEFNLFQREEKFKILMGLSTTIVPFEKNNPPILFSSGNYLYPKNNKFPILSFYFKGSLPVDDNLEVWTSLGVSQISAEEDYFIYVDPIDNSALPIRNMKFDLGYTYGVGIDYKLLNGLIAGFNFIYNVYDFESLITNDSNAMSIAYSSTGKFELLNRSIRIGYAF